MEDSRIMKSAIFLEECLNKRSKCINHEKFKGFLKKFGELAAIKNQVVVIEVKPLGEKCINCQHYISGINLQSSIIINQKSALCSINCLREFKNMKKPKSRKNTDESCTSTSSGDDDIPKQSSRCVVF